MIRAVIYTDNEWAFGSIHYGLSKYIFQYGVDASLLPWDKHYTQQEIHELDSRVDVYVTTPQGYRVLVGDFAVEPSKIVVVAHAVTDLHDMIMYGGETAFDQPKHLAVTSQFLKQKAHGLGVRRVPTVVPVGIDVSWLAGAPARTLRTVGYAGAFQRIDGHTEHDLKRGYLVERCAQQAGLAFSVAAGYHNSFVTMAGFYQHVDCVIIASTEEGAGLPALEAGAAGRLVISTPVGHWPERVGEKGGYEVPIAESEFIKETVRLLEYYKNNSSAFQQKCRKIQQHAKSYDWSDCLEPWVKLLSL